MKTALLYLILLSSIQGVAQHIARYTYHDDNKSQLKEIFHVEDTFNNVLEGPYMSYHLNGNIESKGQFSNNETVGVWEFYYETGKLKMRGALKNNSNYGVWEYFYENGNKQMEGSIINRKREGPWKFYYESGQLKYEGNFAGNKRSGSWHGYYEDGSKQSEIEFYDDKGSAVEYYHSGQKKAEGEKNGLENTGHWKFYYKDGGLQAEGTFVKGKRQGEWTFYFPSGAISSKGSYSDDQAANSWTYYYETGEKSAEGNYENGEKQGIWNAFYSGGGLKSSTIYKGDTGVFNEYYENGNLKAQGTLIAGIKHGLWQYFYQDGKKEGEILFDLGKGNYKGYYPNGNLQTTGLIENDHRVGTWEIYDEDGHLKGYYKPFYESDSVSLADLLKNAERPSRTYGVADYAFGKRKFRYFNAKPMEFNGIILSANPLMAFIGRFPVAAEFYIEERLGHELLAEGIRTPFFQADENIKLQTLYSRGYLISLRQKFYNPDDRFGMFYFGHSLSFINLQHHINLPGTSFEEMVVQSAMENKYLYSLLAGYRFMKNTDSRSFTMDGFISMGAGYRNFVIQGDEEELFDVLPQNKIAIDFNIGITVGCSYPFIKKR